MHRFLVPPSGFSQNEVVFPPEEAKHAARVLRLKPGDEVVVGDGTRLFAARLTFVSGEDVRAALQGTLPGTESPVRVTLYQGLTKADKLEWIVQKATELGVYRIVPVAFSRCVAKAEPGDFKKTDRLFRIAQEAVKQCGRIRTPEIAPPMPFERALCDMADRALLLLPWEDAKSGRIRDVYQAHPGAQDIGVVIGPEGGISASEVEKMAARSALTLSLGPRILRAETAAIASIAMIVQLWGDL